METRRWSWIVGIALVVLGSIVGWRLVAGSPDATRHGFERQGDAERTATAGGGREALVAGGEEAASVATSEPRAAADRDLDRESDREAVRLGSGGRLTDEDGRPVEGAWVVRETVEPWPANWETSWRGQRSASATESIRVRSAADGSFVFPGHLPAGVDGVVFAVHPDLEVPLRYVAAGTTAIDLVARRADPLVVSVRDERGAPVAGARVVQHGLSEPPLWRGGAEPESESDLLRCYRFEFETGADGTVRVPVLPGKSSLQASTVEAVSDVWEGQAQASVELVLRQTFTLEARVRWEDALLAQGDALLLTASVPDGSGWRELGRATLDSPGGLVQLGLPSSPAAEFLLVEVSGAPFVPVERRVPVPETGGSAYVEIDLEVGATVWFALARAGTEADATPEILAGGAVRCLWLDEGAWTIASFGAREDGHIQVRSLPEGTVVVRGSVPGFAPAEQVEISVPLEPARTIVLPVEPAGTVGGVVVEESGSGTTPVTDFAVLVWPVGRPADKATHRFTGREDGRFVVPNAPLGEVYVTASSERFPAPPPELVSVTAEEQTDVTLTLEPGLPLVGQVLDGGTGAPLAEATVQLYAHGPRGAVAPWGGPRAVRPDGRFEFEAGVLGANSIYVEAPGYSALYEHRTVGASDAAVDFGPLRMHGPCSLLVHLEASGGPGALAPLRVRLQGGESPEGATQGERGTLLFDDLRSGSWTVVVEDGGTPIQFVEVRIAPGERRELTIPIADGGLLVTVTASDRELLDRLDSLQADDYADAGERRSWLAELGAPDADQVQASFRGLPAETLRLSAWAADGELLGAATVGGAELQRGDAELPLGGDHLAVTVVLQDGTPVRDAVVRLVSLQPSDHFAFARTDAVGTCRLFGGAEVERRLQVDHPRFGHVWGLAIEDGADEALVQLDSEARVELALYDADRPLAGATLVLESIAGFTAHARKSDGEGRVRLEGRLAGATPYRLEGHGIWTASGLLQPGTSRLHAYRTGAVELQLVDDEERPLAGVEIALTHRELQEATNAWIAAGRIAGPRRTDARGRLVLEAIPRGRYDWRVRGPEHGDATGELEVRAGERTSHRLVVRVMR